MPYNRKYNTIATGATAIRIPLLKKGLSDYAIGTDWTPTAGDVVVSKDGGATANIATLPSYSNGRWTFVLSAAELSCKQLNINIVCASVENDGFDIETTGDPSAMYPDDVNAASTASDSPGVTTLLARIPGAVPLAADYTTARAAKLDLLDVAITTRSSHSVTDVWANATRTLSSALDSAGVTTLLTRVTGLLPLAADFTAVRAAKLDQLDTIPAISAKTTNLPVNPAAVTDIPTASTVAAAVFAGGSVDGMSLTEWLRVTGSVIIGSATGLKTANGSFKSADGAKTRLSVVLDLTTGNRTVTIVDKT